MRRFLTITGELRGVLLTVLFASYFGSLWAGALHFPHGYDWRRNVISNLLSPRDNPGWYWLPSLGVAVAGVCMLFLAAWIESELAHETGGVAQQLRKPAFMVGIGCLILSAIVVPQHTHTVMGMRHAHEVLARTAAAGLGIGMICACQAGALGLSEERGKRMRALRIVWWATTIPPILGAVGSGLVVAIAHLHGTGAAGYLRGTVFWHLAFWEWVGSAAVFVFFAGPVLILGAKDAP